MKAHGRSKTSLFGNSGGAMIALECTASYPEYLDHVIVQEAPVAGLLPDATELLDWFFELHSTYKAKGPRAAGAALQGRMMPTYVEIPPLAQPREEDMENFWKYEFLGFVLYCPDLQRVVENKVSVVAGVWEGSGDAFFRRCGGPLAKRLNCECVEFPGHHSGFENYVEEFAASLFGAINVEDGKQ